MGVRTHLFANPPEPQRDELTDEIARTAEEVHQQLLADGQVTCPNCRQTTSLLSLSRVEAESKINGQPHLDFAIDFNKHIVSIPEYQDELTRCLGHDFADQQVIPRPDASSPPWGDASSHPWGVADDDNTLEQLDDASSLPWGDASSHPWGVVADPDPELPSLLDSPSQETIALPAPERAQTPEIVPVPARESAGPARDRVSHITSPLPPQRAAIVTAILAHREKYKHDPEVAENPDLLDNDVEVDPIFFELPYFPSLTEDLYSYAAAVPFLSDPNYDPAAPRPQPVFIRYSAPFPKGKGRG